VANAPWLIGILRTDRAVGSIYRSITRLENAVCVAEERKCTKLSNRKCCYRAKICSSSVSSLSACLSFLIHPRVSFYSFSIFLSLSLPHPLRLHLSIFRQNLSLREPRRFRALRAFGASNHRGLISLNNVQQRETTQADLETKTLPRIEAKLVDRKLSLSLSRLARRDSFSLRGQARRPRPKSHAGRFGHARWDARESSGRKIRGDHLGEAEREARSRLRNTAASEFNETLPFLGENRTGPASIAESERKWIKDCLRVAIDDERGFWLS